jgi:hypothetical protein
MNQAHKDRVREDIAREFDRISRNRRHRDNILRLKAAEHGAGDLKRPMERLEQIRLDRYFR